MWGKGKIIVHSMIPKRVIPRVVAGRLTIFPHAAVGDPPACKGNLDRLNGAPFGTKLIMCGCKPPKFKLTTSTCGSPMAAKMVDDVWRLESDVNFHTGEMMVPAMVLVSIWTVNIWPNALFSADFRRNVESYHCGQILFDIVCKKKVLQMLPYAKCPNIKRSWYRSKLYRWPCHIMLAEKNSCFLQGSIPYASLHIVLTLLGHEGVLKRTVTLSRFQIWATKSTMFLFLNRFLTWLLCLNSVDPVLDFVSCVFQPISGSSTVIWLRMVRECTIPLALFPFMWW